MVRRVAVHSGYTRTGDVLFERQIPNTTLLQERNKIKNSGERYLRYKNDARVSIPSHDDEFTNFIISNSTDQRIVDGQERLRKVIPEMQLAADSLQGFWCKLAHGNKTVAAAYFFKRFDWWNDGRWDFNVKYPVISQEYLKGKTNFAWLATNIRKLVCGGLVFLSTTNEIHTPIRFGKLRFCLQKRIVDGGYNVLRTTLKKWSCAPNHMITYVKQPVLLTD